MGRPKGSKNKMKDSQMLMEELDEKATKTLDEALETAEMAKKEPQDEIIEVEFYNIEEPGVPIKFSYGQPKRIKTYTLMHGGVYKLPREIVRHLESREKPIFEYRPDGTGSMKKQKTGYKSRFQCRQVWK